MEHTQHPVEEPHMHDGFTRPLMLVWDHLLHTVYVEPMEGDWARQQALISEPCVDCNQCDQPLTVVSDWATLCRILAQYTQWGMGTDGLMEAAHQAAAYLGAPNEAEAVLPVLHARLSMVASTPQTVLDQFDAWKHAYLQLRDERDRLRHERRHPVSRLIPLDANTYSRLAIRPV